MDATDRRDRSDRRDTRAPLYDARFEHDACGVGFVADAGGRSARKVLPLALAGLAALAHRGAFAADGESSDGAGVALPLTSSVLALIAGPRAVDRPGVVMAFLPRGAAARRASRGLVEDVFAQSGLPVVAWRSVPFEPTALGAVASASRPFVAQAIVTRPDGLTDRAFERRLVVARRRLETAARVARGGIAGLSIPSASCRTVVYKGLVAGTRLADLYPDLRAELDVTYAVFHQRYATNTTPIWRLAQPFRSIAHNGEINTVRGNREQVRGRTRDRGAKPIAAELLDAGPLLTADGSDSLSLDEGLELLTTTGWDLAPALLAAIPEAVGLRRAPHPHVATLRRRAAGMLAPWDGPAAIVFADGRRVGALVDRNGLRPAAFAVTRDRLVAVASEAGAVPFEARDTIRRGRLGPGEMLLVEPARRAILEDTDAKAHVLRRSADPRRTTATPRGQRRGRGGGDRGSRSARSHPALPRGARRREGTARYQDHGARGARAVVEHGRRHAHGRPRSSGPAGGRPPSPGLRAGDQPGHRPRAGAGRHGPSSRARAAPGAAGRTPSRATHAAPRAPDRGRPRRSSRGGARRRAPGARAGRDVAGRRRRARASRVASSASQPRPSPRARQASRSC